MLTELQASLNILVVEHVRKMVIQEALPEQVGGVRYA